DVIRAKSLLPFFLMPQCKPVALNPLGYVPEVGIKCFLLHVVQELAFLFIDLLNFIDSNLLVEEENDII
ncbi:676_t:CDS:1, partial [Entrophospora sp. SA101]